MRIFPPPRKITEMPGYFGWPKVLEVSIPEIYRQLQEFQSLKNVLRKFVQDVKYHFVDENEPLLTIGSPVILPAQSHGQGYSLKINSKGISVSGVESDGLRYGLETLRQIIEQSGKSVKCVLVQDYPAFVFRGFGSFFGGHDTDKNRFASKALRRDLPFYVNLLTKCRLNRFTHLSIEPQVFNHDTQLAAFATACRENNIKPLPVHPYFGMQNNRRIREYATASHVEFQKILMPLRHSINLLEPEIVCIGGDELVSCYEYSLRKSLYSPGIKDAPEMLAKAILRFYDFLSTQGIRMAIWADALIDERRFSGFPAAVYGFGGKGDEHWKIAKMLPRDIMLWDWQYVPQIQYPTLDYLLQKGFEVIGCPKSPWGNIELFSEYAAGKTEGMLCADWWEPLLTDMDCPASRMESPASVFRAGNAFWSPGRYADKLKDDFRVLSDRHDLVKMNRCLKRFRKVVGTDIWVQSEKATISMSSGFANKGWVLLGRSGGLKSGLVLPNGLGAKPARTLDVEFCVPFPQNSKQASVEVRLSSMFSGSISCSRENVKYGKLETTAGNGLHFAIKKGKMRFFRIKIVGKNISDRTETLLKDILITFGAVTC